MGGQVGCWCPLPRAPVGNIIDVWGSRAEAAHPFGAGEGEVARVPLWGVVGITAGSNGLSGDGLRLLARATPLARDR
jgi:hypothetical protein